MPELICLDKADIVITWSPYITNENMWQSLICKITAHFIGDFIYHGRLVVGRSFGAFAKAGLYIPLFGKAEIYLRWLKYVIDIFPYACTSYVQRDRACVYLSISVPAIVVARRLTQLNLPVHFSSLKFYRVENLFCHHLGCV